MSREKSQFLSSFGTAFQVFKAITDEVLIAGGSDDDLRRVLSDEGLARKIAKVIMGGDQCFKVIVDYDQTLKQMICAGQYDWIDNDIVSNHFPVTGTGQKETEITLFHFNRVISSDNAIVEMAKAGYRPALVEELLTLGAAYKELQKKFPIVALGSVWQAPGGSRGVPSLHWDGRGRRQGRGGTLRRQGRGGAEDRRYRPRPGRHAAGRRSPAPAARRAGAALQG